MECWVFEKEKKNCERFFFINPNEKILLIIYSYELSKIRMQ